MVKAFSIKQLVVGFGVLGTLAVGVSAFLPAHQAGTSPSWNPWQPESITDKIDDKLKAIGSDVLPTWAIVSNDGKASDVVTTTFKGPRSAVTATSGRRPRVGTVAAAKPSAPATGNVFAAPVLPPAPDTNGGGNNNQNTNPDPKPTPNPDPDPDPSPSPSPTNSPEPPEPTQPPVATVPREVNDAAQAAGQAAEEGGSLAGEKLEELSGAPSPLAPTLALIGGTLAEIQNGWQDAVQSVLLTVAQFLPTDEEIEGNKKFINDEVNRLTGSELPETPAEVGDAVDTLTGLAGGANLEGTLEDAGEAVTGAQESVQPTIDGVNQTISEGGGDVEKNVINPTVDSVNGTVNDAPAEAQKQINELSSNTPTLQEITTVSALDSRSDTGAIIPVLAGHEYVFKISGTYKYAVPADMGSEADAECATKPVALGGDGTTFIDNAYDNDLLDVTFDGNAIKWDAVGGATCSPSHTYTYSYKALNDGAITFLTRDGHEDNLGVLTITITDKFLTTQPAGVTGGGWFGLLMSALVLLQAAATQLGRGRVSFVNEESVTQ